MPRIGVLLSGCGGFGVAKNLSDFAVKGPDASVHPEPRRILEDMAQAGKPIEPYASPRPH